MKWTYDRHVRSLTIVLQLFLWTYLQFILLLAFNQLFNDKNMQTKTNYFHL